ncbi:hypothetical protein J2S43_004698 [Catenuloplanes nepalensis]|uniref:Uncharacterized protein n=1 Tax=Catenuloplanes nepalensis TaxID=587533 RepID=A0ABT9MY71_9ACTN|nr:hypothetical protein [Catenuloplanes nepalensis]MDP9796186.1 hypothetical protein [Catenuloplanes nepalensis]
MDLPIAIRHADAICIDHMLPTATGAHLHTESISTRNRDPRLRATTGLPAMKQYAYLTFGKEITDALAGGTHPGVARAQGVLHQFLRGVPPESADRYVVRLAPDGLTLADVARRADLIGLPVEVPRAGLAAGPPIGPHRVIGVDGGMRVVPAAGAEFLRVLPDRHRAADAYANVPPEVLDLALRTPYPRARLVFGDDGVRLGLPAPLARHAYAETLRRLSRPLRPADTGGTPSRDIAGYGDLLAAVAEPGTRAFVTVRAPSGAELTVLALHDAHGVSFLDPGTADAALLPAAPSRITFTPVAGEQDLATWLDEIRAARPAAAARPVNRTPAVHALPIGATGRSVDVIGSPGALTDRFRAEITAAAEGVDAPVLVVATDRQSRGPSEGQLANLEWMLFQHRRNQQAGGDPPIVVIHGDAPPAVTALLGGYDFAMVHQPRTSGGGLNLNLDNLWSARDAAGNTIAAPMRTITTDLLRKAGAARPALTPAGPEADERLLSFLSTPVSDVAAIRGALAEHGSALKTLLPRIGTLGTVRKDLFAAWEAILRIEARADTALAGAAFDYLGAGEGRQQRSLAVVPALLDKDPETRGDALTDLIDLTRGPLDDGASRAILDGIRRGMAGAPDAELKQLIYRHSAYLPEHGRTDWIRQLRDLAGQRPEQTALFEKIALYVETCP